jgi:hypothetical protein
VIGDQGLLRRHIPSDGASQATTSRRRIPVVYAILRRSRKRSDKFDLALARMVAAFDASPAMGRRCIQICRSSTARTSAAAARRAQARLSRLMARAEAGSP